MLDNLVGFHIEPTNICTLKCAGCARTRFIKQWPQHWKNYNLNIDQLLNFLDIDLTERVVLLCGNYGDPIYHPDFVDFVTKLKQRGSIIRIITNGSYRTPEWWNQLTSVLTANDCITFSIDGIPSNFTQYRINADWESIHQGIKIAVKSACQTTWKYIPFSFNSADIESAEKFSQDLGINQFLVDPSDRFDKETEFLKPDEKLLGSRFNAQAVWKLSNLTSEMVNPKCYTGREHYITADGYYSPCCYLADHRFYYKNLFGKHKKNYDITQTTISQILTTSPVLDFHNNLDQNPGCQFNCPASS
jgi:organic radical activating enzyme